MNTGKTLQLGATSLEGTLKVGELIGQNLKGCECLLFVSDVGAGKTTMSKGIAKGAGSDDEVASPTFTISRIYKGKDFNIHHYDFYRLDEAGIVSSEIAESLSDKETVVLVEWGDIVSDVLPDEYVQIDIETGQNEDSRNISIKAPDKYSYILEGLS